MDHDHACIAAQRCRILLTQNYKEASMVKGESTTNGINLRVRFTAGGLENARPNTKDFAGRVLAQLDAPTRAALIHAEPKVMAWLRADRANVTKVRDGSDRVINRGRR